MSLEPMFLKGSDDVLMILLFGLLVAKVEFLGIRRQAEVFQHPVVNDEAQMSPLLFLHLGFVVLLENVNHNGN